MPRYSLDGVRAATDQPHRDLVARATEVLADDPRVVAAWLVGSLANGDADAFSDVDLRCAPGRSRSGPERNGRRPTSARP